MEGQMVVTNGIRLHVMQAGPKDGPLVILLHGFPEFSYSWRKLMPQLVSAGYRVWAPDQRGYNLSDKPKGISAYSVDELARDVVGLMDAAGQQQAIVIGHDWGAGVAWWLAGKYPERVSRMVVMNVPHGKVMRDYLRSNLRQLLKSWYMFFFQVPWLPEQLARLGNWKMLVKLLKATSRRGTFSEEDFENYRAAWSQPRAYHSMLNWYRAYIQQPLQTPENPRITVPTMLIWGKKDGVLSYKMAQPSIDLCDNGRLEFIEDATHWLHHEKPEQVNALISEYLRD